MTAETLTKPKVSEMPVRLALFRDILLITDPGRDQDDEDVLVMLNRFIRTQILNMLGVVANLKPSVKRARLAKGTLDILGLDKMPVGFGSGHEVTEDDGLEYQFDVTYLSPADAIVDGKELMIKTLRAAKPKSLVLVLISQLTDAATILREYTRLFETAVRRVVIMGGVQINKETDLPELDGEGRLIPDMSAQNHSFDKDSTRDLYRHLQDLGIPITVVTRHAATAAKVPRSIYDDMAATGHPVGIRLLKAQKAAIQELWQRACLPTDDKGRNGLPARCNKAWFCEAFCANQGQDRKPEDSIWDIVQNFNLYDPATLVAAIPNLREHFFAPSVVEVHGVEHLVIGVSATNHNVANPTGLAEFMRNTMVESLEVSLGLRLVG